MFSSSSLKRTPSEKPNSDGKESTYNMRDLGSIPGLGRSPGEGNGYPLQNSGLENSIDCIVHGVSKSETQLINFHFMTEPQFYCTLLKSHLGPADATFSLTEGLCIIQRCNTMLWSRSRAPGLPWWSNG